MSEQEVDLLAPPRWEVIQDDLRPAGNGRDCFYCGVPLGGRHLDECVIPGRPVAVRMTVDVIRRVPVSWGKEDIEFQMNEGSWCANNIMDDMEKTAEKVGCLCHSSSFEFIGDVDLDRSSHSADSNTGAGE